jgi:hypothetical protein
MAHRNRQRSNVCDGAAAVMIWNMKLDRNEFLWHCGIRHANTSILKFTCIVFTSRSVYDLCICFAFFPVIIHASVAEYRQCVHITLYVGSTTAQQARAYKETRNEKSGIKKPGNFDQTCHRSIEADIILCDWCGPWNPVGWRVMKLNTVYWYL